jgi:glycerophosphoryl diester phosphodiesterase
VGDFITNPGSQLPGPKTDQKALPPKADANEHIRASDYNALRGAANDLRSAVIDGAGPIQQAASSAQAAKTAAELARDAANVAGKTYASTAAGLAATVSGQYFNVPSGSANESLLLYRNNAGAATLLKKYPSSEWVEEPARRTAGAWFHKPYVEKVGNSMYFKPTAFGAGTDVFFVRGNYYPDYACTYQKVKDDLVAQVPAFNAEIALGVTSPAGVADCIQFANATCLWWNPTTSAFYAGERARRFGDLLIVHQNYDRIGPCVMQAELLDAVSGLDAETYRASTLVSIIPSAGGLPNILAATKRLEFPADTLLLWKDQHWSLPATSVDITGNGSSAQRVFFRPSDQVFVLKSWDGGLAQTEARTLLLVATIRIINGKAQASMACPYTVDGVDPLPAAAGTVVPGGLPGMAAVIMPLTAAPLTPSRYYPTYDEAARTFTLFKDTILVYRNARWILAADASVVMTGSSANKIYWDTSTSTLQVRMWSTNLTADELAKFVLVAVARQPGGAIPTALGIAAPYMVNGKLFGQDLGSGTSENRLDAFVRGVAHRGYSITAPENTLPAYRLAKKMGFSYVECDVRWTSDEVPVLLHDGTIDRTSDGSGNLGAFTLAQVRAFDFGSWKSAEYTGTQIPTLEEFLRLCFKLSLHPYMELKDGITAGRATALVNLLKKTGMHGRVTFIAFGRGDLELIKAADPTIRLGYLITLASQAIADTLAYLKTATNEVFIDTDSGACTQALVDEANTAGVPVEAWTVNDSATTIALAEMGVRGITTDTVNVSSVLRTDENAI